MAVYWWRSEGRILRGVDCDIYNRVSCLFVCLLFGLFVYLFVRFLDTKMEQ